MADYNFIIANYVTAGNTHDSVAFHDLYDIVKNKYADAKEKHGMRYTHLRSLAKMNMEVTLTFACMNLKKFANHRWQRTGGYISDSTYILSFVSKSYKNNLKLTYFLNIFFMDKVYKY